ncbi:MAG: DUF998 domain-containing protein [Candidatus Hermodarchaeota archaeon]
MEKLDNFYKKIHGSYMAFIGLAIFLIGLIIAITVEPNFSFFVHYISDLGDPTNSAYIIFNFCWFIAAIFIILFLIFFTQYLQEKGGNVKGTRICLVFGIISALGIMGLAIFNGVDFPTMHLVSQYVFFFAGILYLLYYTILEYKIPGFPKAQAILNLIVAYFFIEYLVIQIVSSIGIIFSPGVNSFTEWLFLFANLFWFFENGLYSLKVK